MTDEAGRLAVQLDRFGQDTDEEFTTLARGLSELTAQFARMREQAATLDDILHDRDEDKALAAAYTLCKNSIDLVHASLGISHSMQSQMSNVDASLAQACSAREDFEKSFLLLRTLAMGFRIEAARVDREFQGVFTNVAAAIREIDDKIVASTTRAFQNIQDLVTHSAAERKGIHQDEEALYSQATASIRMVQDDIEAVRRALAPCMDANLRIGELLTQAQPHTIEVLKALQVQDIVRQKLEHVATGLRDITEHAFDQVFLHRAAQLQNSHLTSSRDEFENAGKSVTDGLSRLLDVGCKIDDQLKIMETAAVGALGRSKMAELFQREILHLARIADSSEEANRRIAGLVEQIDSVVTMFSREIGSHEREVKLVALNAQIAAARVGSAGALEKLAEETSTVAGRNAETTRKLAANLQGTLDRLRRIKAEADEFLSTVTGEKQMLEQGASDVGRKLVRHRTTIQDHSHTVRAEFSAVHGGIRALLDGIQFPSTIANTFDPAKALCDNLARCTGDALKSEELSQAGARRFHAHLDLYTMQEERDAHAAVLKGTTPSHGVQAAARTATTDDVEFFDMPASLDEAGPSNDGSDIELFSEAEDPTDTVQAQPRFAPALAPDTPATPTQSAEVTAAENNDPQNPVSKARTPSASSDLGDGIELF